MIDYMKILFATSEEFTAPTLFLSLESLYYCICHTKWQGFQFAYLHDRIG